MIALFAAPIALTQTSRFKRIQKANEAANAAAQARQAAEAATPTTTEMTFAQSSPAAPSDPRDEMNFSSFKSRCDGSELFVNGLVQNNSSSTYSFQFTLNIESEDGSTVYDTVSDAVSSLRAGEQRSFEAIGRCDQLWQQAKVHSQVDLIVPG